MRIGLIRIPGPAELERRLPDAPRAPGTTGRSLHGFSIWRCTCGSLRAGGINCFSCGSSFNEFERTLGAKET